MIFDENEDQVLVKDNYGNKKKVHVKDVKPIEMDIATAEFFRKEREQCTTRDAKHVMPIKLIPDLEWKFIENINVMESDKGVTIYCINEAEDENEDTQVTKVSEPKSDAKISENIELDVTEAAEASGNTQTNDDSGVTEIGKHRETRKEAENTSISQTTLVDPERDTETTEVSEHTISKEIKRTDTVDVTEVITGTPEPTLVVTSKEKEESTSPVPLQKENPEIQDSKDTTEIDAEYVNKETHKYPETNNSLVNKIFSVFRQAKESMEAIPL